MYFLHAQGIRTQSKRIFLLVMISGIIYRRVPSLSRQFPSSDVDCGFHVSSPVSLTVTGIRQPQEDFIACFGVRNNIPTFVLILVFHSTGQEAILDSKLATLYLENEAA